MTRYRFYNDSLLLSLIRHLKAATMSQEDAEAAYAKATRKLKPLGPDFMQPTPKPLTIYHLTTYCDDRKRVVIERRTVPDKSVIFDSSGPEYIGQSMAMVQTQDPRTRQVVTQPMQFDFIIPATSIHEAFALFDSHQEPGFHKHLEALKIASIKQGADLSQLPKPGKN